MSIKISELTSGTTLDGTEVLPIVQDGATVKITAQDVADLASSSGAVWGGITGDITDQTDLVTALNLKVDAVPGKGLSANDFTNTLKTKLDGIQDGAQVNVNADWNATSGDAQILNKPTIPSITGLVPYTSATSDVDLGEFELKAGQIELDQTPTGTAGVAVMRWNDTDGTIDLGLKGGNVTLQVGQEQVLRVVNKTATNVNLLEANYQAVRVTGAQGQRLKVDLAQATTDALSAETIGLVTETINNNQEGFITTSGIVRNINTTGSLQSETWADGDIVYLSPTTAGRITNIKPSAPNHLIIIGYVISAHATQGSVFVKVDNGYELDELHNVAISTPLNNQSLVYETATTLWKNKALTTAEVSDSTNKRYVTDAEAVVIGNTSGTNTGDQDLSGLLEKTGGAMSGQLTYATPVTLASASTVNLGSAGSNIVYISGTTAITSFGTSTNTNLIYVKFLGILTLTYNATSMQLPGANNITTAANDEAVFLNMGGGGNWKCISYNPYSVTGTGPQVRQASPTLTGNPTVGNSTGTSTLNLGTGANGAASTKTINIGTNGLSGTTTNINIGSAVAGSTTTVAIAGNVSATNLSGTNTGDETQSSILSKLGWFKTLVTTNYSVTGTTGETLILPSTQLPTLSNGTIFKINTLRISKGALAGTTIRAYLSPNSNNLTGALQILSTGSTIVAGTRLATISRVFEIEGGNIKGLNAATGVLNDNGTSTVAGLDSALPSGTLYLIVTVTNALTTETTTQELLDISNF